MRLNNAKFRWAPNSTVREHYRLGVEEVNEDEDDEDIMGDKIDGPNSISKAFKKLKGKKPADSKAG